MSAVVDVIAFVFSGVMVAFQSPILLAFFIFTVLMFWMWLQRLSMATVMALSIPITYYLQTLNYSIFHGIYVLNLIIVGALIALAIYSKISK